MVSHKHHHAHLHLLMCGYYQLLCCVSCNLILDDVCTIVTDVTKVAEYLTVSETHDVELDALICQTV